MSKFQSTQIRIGNMPLIHMQYFKKKRQKERLTFKKIFFTIFPQINRSNKMLQSINFDAGLVVNKLPLGLYLILKDDIFGHRLLSIRIHPS